MRRSMKFLKPARLASIRIAKVFIGIITFAACKTSEPAFTVKGDKMLLKDTKINVAMLKHDSSTIATAYYKGKMYDVNNQSSLRYVIYVSYKDSLFYKIEFDNLHHEMKAEALNELIVGKKGNAVVVWYKPLKESTIPVGHILLPWNIFVDEIADNAIAKDKFTVFYGSK
ncbi:hypothetical protein [Pedobacter sp. GR22-6]|uniref:hypothetical protein n=1 Tax=Pedobacter sp. GR22-6 TaxID=3127957 RepID=UPI00307FACC6